MTGFPRFVKAGSSATFTVTALDPAGNVATGYAGTVTFSSTDGSATLPSSYTFTASDQGVHTFTATLNTTGTQSLTVTDSGHSLTATEGNIVVHAAGASLIPVTTHRDLIFDAQRHILYITTSGGTIERYDLASGDLLTPFQLIDPLNGGDITATGNALYVADGQRNLIQGFIDKVDLSTGNISRLMYDLAGGGYFEDAAWDVALGPANLGLVTTQFPGSGWTPLRQLDTNTDTFSIRTDDPGSGGGGQVRQNTPVRRGGDRSEFILTESNISSGPFFAYNAVTNKFSSQEVDTNTFLDGRSSAVNRNGTLLALDVFNSGVTIYDANLNVVKVLSGVDGGLLFDPLRDLLYVASGGFVDAYNTNTWNVSFSLTIGESVSFGVFGNGVMSMSSDGQWLFVATSSGVRILSVPVTVSSFSISGLPATMQAGTAQSFTLTALDNTGHTATGYTGTVHFTSTDPQAVLPADYTFTAADAGQHTFSVTLGTAGNQTITATDTANASITGTSNGILVKPASFLVSGFPSPTTAGVAHSFSVTAENANGTTAAGYTGTVHFMSSDGQALLPADYTFVSADAGVHTFSATLKKAGTQSLTATDTTLASVIGSQTGITVNAAALSKLAVTNFPSPTVAGVSHSFTVTAEDAYGNTVTSYLGTVHFTSTDKKAVLPANYTFLAGDAGMHSFTATLKTAGTQTITAKDTVKTTISGTEPGIIVNPSAASHFKVTAPATSTAGVAFSITVTALDPYGNTATGYTGTVHFTSSDKKAVLPANYTFTGTDAGVHVFSNGVILKTAGTQTVTATDTATASVKGSASIKVAAAAASSLRITAPARVTHGVPFTFKVTVVDAFGNVATGYTGTVHFTSSDGAASLPADYKFTTSDAGVHTFSATLHTTGSQSLTATDTLTSAITGTDPAIQVV